ncbi:MAG: hypothetical protein HFACDABA_00582 [Anaerolineales bacterium]|nr:hypothetical protein [Anaerolineales bacterium]
MKRTSILILFLLLASCAAPTESALTETPEATATAQATVTSTAVAVVALTATPEAIGPNTIATESMGCFKSDMCLGLEVVDGSARYTELLGAFAGAYENRTWMGGIKTAEQFRAFLKTSMHPDPETGEMKPYWVPLERNGGTFKILQGNGSATGGIFSDKNPAVVEAEGFFLDDIAFVAASKAQMDENEGGIADWIKKMEEQNGRNALIKTSSVPIEKWGLVLVDGQLVFVGLNNSIPTNPDLQKNRLLGQVDTKRDAQIMSAMWELYTRVYGRFANVKDHISNSALEPDSNKWDRPYLCIAGLSGMCEGRSPVWFAGENALFVPVTVE